MIFANKLPFYWLTCIKYKFVKMASSSDNESDNSAEEIAAPTRRTRSGRASTSKATRRGRRRGGAAPRARATRKSTRMQQEEEEEEDEEEEVDQGQGSDTEELTSIPNTDEPPQFESESTGPVFDQLEGDQFGLQEAADEEEMEESLGKANGIEDDSPLKQDSSDEDSDNQKEEKVMTREREQRPASSDSEDVPEQKDASSDSEDVPQQPRPASEDVEMAEIEDSNKEDKTELQEENETSNTEAPVVETKAENSLVVGPKAEEDCTEATDIKSETNLSVKQEPEKKRKRRGFSDAPVQEFGPPMKKQVKDEATVNGEKTKEEDGSSPEDGDSKPARRRKLPELDKYWKAVREDASDFTGWTYLLQYVDQESDVEAAREAYDAFLSLYPYCYGYWRKYADFEKRKGSPENCDKVFERGLRAIPLSVDLWLHYLNHCKAKDRDDDTYIRQQFDLALENCGMEFRSDRLWESYIRWETENKNFQNVTAVYDKLLATPTQGYTSHFDAFEALAKAHLPQKLLSVDEFLTIRKEWLESRKAKEEAAAAAEEDAEGEKEKETEETASVEQKQKEEIAALREKLIESRKEIHKTTVAAVADRWNFEEGVKRPYFHVKPLEKSQLRNWREYIDFEIEQGDRKRIVVLFERCLIACALYEEFWAKFLNYLEGQKDESLVEKIRAVYVRACTIHHNKKANLHLHWAAFEEKQLNWDQAANILESLEKHMPGLLQLAYRRINLERRRGDLEKASKLYDSYITSFKNQTISTNLAIKHARFCWKIKGDLDCAISALTKALDKDKANSRLYLQLIDMHMQRTPMDVTAVVSVFDRFLTSEASAHNKATFAQRKLEFLEDFGDDIDSVLKAQEEQQQFQKQARENKKDSQEKTCDSGSGNNSTKKSKSNMSDWVPPIPSQPPPPHPSGQYNQSQGYAGQAGSYNAAQYGTQQQGYQAGSYTQYPPPNSASADPNSYYQNWGGYGGYNQGWGNYNYY